MSKLETNTIDTVSGTSTLQVGSTNTSTITLGVSGDTVNVPSGVTIANSGTATGFGGTNTPAFSAYMAADQSSLTDNTYVKLTMESEFFDSDGKYNTSNQRFTPTVAGKYMFGCSVYIDATDTMDTGIISFYKNGSQLLYANTNVDNDNKFQLTGIITLDTDDYVELYANVNVASGGTWRVNADGTTANNRTYWYGYKIIT